MRSTARIVLVLGLLAPLAGCLPSPPPLCGAEFSVTADGGDVGSAPDVLALGCPPPLPPPPDCIGCAGSHGDPHITTFDRRLYSMQPAGELTALLVDDVEVQLRIEPSGTRVASTTAVAVRRGDVRLSVQPAPDGGWVVRRNGRVVELSADERTLLGEGSVGLDEEGWVVAQWPDGLLVHVQLHAGYSGVDVRLPDEHGEVVGIWGDADGDPSNDVVPRGVAEPLTDDDLADREQLYGRFVESWRVTDATSLFDYTAGESTASYTDRGFPPEVVGVDDLTDEQRAAAEEVCRAAGVTDPTVLAQCVLDVALTGDASYTQVHARRQVVFGFGGAGRPGGTDGPRGDVAPASPLVAWTSVLDGVEQTEPGLDHDGVGHVLVPGRDMATDEAVVVALDEATGEEAWRVSGIDPGCPVVATGDGRVVAQGDEGGPLGVDGVVTHTLVVIDARTGEVVGRPAAPDVAGGVPRLNECRYGFTIVGDVVVIDGGGATHGFDIGDGAPRHSWVWEHDGVGTTRTTAAVGDRVVIGTQVRDDVRLVLLDAGTGEELDDLPLPGGRFDDPATLVAVDDVVVTSLVGDGADDDVITRTLGVRVVGDRLEERWSITGRRQDAAPLLSQSFADGVVAVDGLAVGHVGATIVALDAADGGVAWTYELPSFRNQDPPVAVDRDGNVYDGTFGAAWIVSVAPGGVERWALQRDDLFVDPRGVGDVSWFGPVVDERLFVDSSFDDAVLVVAVEVDR
jgi:outer membrane protein assembly factor BamB